MLWDGQSVQGADECAADLKLPAAHGATLPAKQVRRSYSHDGQPFFFLFGSCFSAAASSVLASFSSSPTSISNLFSLCTGFAVVAVISAMR